MAEHELKTWPEFFDAVWRGVKTFEVRKDDRGFAVGDMLLLREYDAEADTYSGRWLTTQVTYILGGAFTLPGTVVMGIKPPRIRAADVAVREVDRG